MGRRVLVNRIREAIEDADDTAVQLSRHRDALSPEAYAVAIWATYAHALRRISNVVEVAR